MFGLTTMNKKRREFSSLTVKLRANIDRKLHIAIDDCFLHGGTKFYYRELMRAYLCKIPQRKQRNTLQTAQYYSELSANCLRTNKARCIAFVALP